MIKNKIAHHLPVENQTQAKSPSPTAGIQSKTSESHGNQAGHQGKPHFLPFTFSLLPFLALFIITCSLFIVGCDQPENASDGVIVPVAGIDGVYAAVQKGAEVDLSGARVFPETATNKSIAWRVVAPGYTRVTGVIDGKFTPAYTGQLRLKAVIANGAAAGQDYTQEFTINVCDTENVMIEPATPRIQAGASVQFSALVVDENTQTVTWTLTGNLKSGTVISENGTLTVDPDESALALLTVSATSTANSEKSGSTIAMVTHSPVVIGPQRGGYTETIAQGAQITFMAQSVGYADNVVDWELSGATKAGTSFSDSVRVLTVDVDEPVGTMLTLRAALKESETDALNTDGSRKRGALELRVVPAVSSVSVNEPEGGRNVVKEKTLSLSAKVNGVNSNEVIFTISPQSASMAASMRGVLYVPRSETAATVKVRATSKVDETKYGEIDINILDAPQVTSVTVSPATPSVGQGGTQVFTATVVGVGNVSQQVKWSITGGTGTTAIANKPGNIGAYTQYGATLSVASNQVIASGSITVTATAKDKDGDGVEVTGSTTVTVTAPVATVTSVTVSPAKANMPKGYTGSPFTQTVTGTNGPAQEVTWSLTGSTNGSSIDAASGAITIGAGETNTTLTVKATSTLDTSKYGTATITVRANDWTEFSSVTSSSATTGPYATYTTSYRTFAYADNSSDKWYIFSGDSGNIRSKNLSLWYRTTTSASKLSVIYDIAGGTYNDAPVFIAVGVNGLMAKASGTMITSTSASTAWTQITAANGKFAASETIKTVFYGGGVFIAGSTIGTISRSTDGGANWANPTTNPFSANYTIRSIVFDGNSTFYMVADGNAVGNNVKLARSTDNGDNWTELPSLQAVFGTGSAKVAFGGGKIVVAGSSDSGFKVVVSSDNGVTWTAAVPGCFVPDVFSSSIGTIIYDGARFIIIGGDLVNSYSTDGQNWTRLIFGAASGANLIGNIKYDGANYVGRSQAKIFKISSLF